MNHYRRLPKSIRTVMRKHNIFRCEHAPSFMRVGDLVWCFACGQKEDAHLPSVAFALCVGHHREAPDYAARNDKVFAEALGVSKSVSESFAAKVIPPEQFGALRALGTDEWRAFRTSEQRQGVIAFALGLPFAFSSALKDRVHLIDELLGVHNV